MIQGFFACWGINFDLSKITAIYAWNWVKVGE